MNKEDTIKLGNSQYDQLEKLAIQRASYMNKQDFIKVLEDMPFNCIVRADIDVVTGFIKRDNNEKYKEEYRPVGYTFKIGDDYYA